MAAALPIDPTRNRKLRGAAARRLAVPVVVTEQYPRGRGRTLPDLRALLDDVTPLEKTAFSCCGADGFTGRLKALGAEPVILTGIEAHVCVLRSEERRVGKECRSRRAPDHYK